MAATTTRRVAREPLLALAEIIAAECQEQLHLAGCEIKLRGWEVGTRAEDWRLVLTGHPPRREYQLGSLADWERLKRSARHWPTGAR